MLAFRNDTEACSHCTAVLCKISVTITVLHTSHEVVLCYSQQLDMDNEITLDRLTEKAAGETQSCERR